MIPGTERVSVADLRPGDMVLGGSTSRVAWGMVIAVGFDLESLAPSEEVTVVYDDGAQHRLEIVEGETLVRHSALLMGFRPEDVAASIEHAEKTVDGLQRKIARLRRLQGLVDALIPLREAR